jgi:hypothetical protein
MRKQLEAWDKDDYDKDLINNHFYLSNTYYLLTFKNYLDKYLFLDSVNKTKLSEEPKILEQSNNFEYQ